MSEEQKVKISNIIWSVVGAVATLGYIAILVLGIGDMDIPVETMAMLPPVVQSGIVGLQTLSGRLIVGWCAIDWWRWCCYQSALWQDKDWQVITSEPSPKCVKQSPTTPY